MIKEVMLAVLLCLGCAKASGTSVEQAHALIMAKQHQSMVDKHNPQQHQLTFELEGLELIAVVFVWNMSDGWIVADSLEGSPGAPRSGVINVTPSLGFQANNVLLALYSPQPGAMRMPALQVRLAGETVARQRAGASASDAIGMRGWYALAVEVRDGVRIVQPTQAHEHEIFNKLAGLNSELVARQLSSDAGRAMALGQRGASADEASGQPSIGQLVLATGLLMLYSGMIMPSMPTLPPADRETQQIYELTDNINQQQYFQWLDTRGY